MAVATLKSLHKYLTLLESAPEMKRKMPTSSNQRSLKEGLSEISKLVGIDDVASKDPQNIAAVIGPQRFVMIWGQPSVTVIGRSGTVEPQPGKRAGQPETAACRELGADLPAFPGSL